MRARDEEIQGKRGGNKSLGMEKLRIVRGGQWLWG